MARAAAGGSRAVETYLRNFEGEKSRYSEILEMTLCYGVQCLARTYSLKGISCNELHTITNYDSAKNRDFHVRNASHPIVKESCVSQRKPVKLRSKPSHSWRDGEVEIPEFPDSSAMTQAGPHTEVGSSGTEYGDAALYSLSPAFDEIDFYTKWLGKRFVALAWRTFARDEIKISTRQELKERFICIDQRLVCSEIPAPDLPVTSFAEFLGAYATECVRQARRMACESNENKSDDEDNSGAHRIGEERGRISGQNGRRRLRGDNSRAAPDNTNSLTSPRVNARRRQRPLTFQRQLPHSLQHLQSKIQPDLDARRLKNLRVKKTQSQRIRETLARTRIAEYDARREPQNKRYGSFGLNKMPLSKITKGAAALEIVDGFLMSPLMDTFSRDNLPDLEPSTGDTDQGLSAQKDPLQEELYGTAALNSSVLGCKPVPQRWPLPKSKLRRNFNGWLGDFGPLHTKTVRPEWNYDAAHPECIEKTTFEWNFDHLPGGRHETGDKPKLRSNETKKRAHLREDITQGHVKRVINDIDDSLSDELSVNSDSVYQWLKDAV